MCRPESWAEQLFFGGEALIEHALPADLFDGHDNSYTAHDWGLEYLPVSARAERTDRFPRGRVTGGSTAVNTTIALRGTPADYDGWAALGNPAWAWPEVLRAFNRLERDLDFGDAPYHGDAGPISIRRFTADELVPTQAAFLQACAAAGHPVCTDVNAPDAVGAGVMAVNKLGRLRVSVAIGYLAAARYRPNLRIVAGATVRRVLFEGRRAVGVELEPGPHTDRDGAAATGRLRADVVVLCGGAVHTPGLLVRSGIGSAAELERFGVAPVHVNEGVGACLQDHPALAVVCLARHPELCATDLPLVQTITRYTAAGSDRPLDVNIELITRARWGGNRYDREPRAFLLAPSLEQVDGRGRIVLRTRTLGSHNIGPQRHKLVACVQVEDDGPGVPEEMRRTLFMPLVTAKADGTGLGLAVAQDMVARHGGIIEFDSRAGHTVFSIMLPLEEAA